MAVVERTVARLGAGDETATLTIVYDDVPVNVGGGKQGLVAQELRVHNPTTYGFWVGVRHVAGGKTAQRIFPPQTDQTFGLPQGQAARFWFTVRPDGKLDGLGFETGFVTWTGATERPDWP